PPGLANQRRHAFVLRRSAVSQTHQRHRQDPQYPVSTEPDAHRRAGLDQRAGGMAEANDRRTQALSVQLEERRLLPESDARELQLSGTDMLKGWNGNELPEH